MLKLQIQWNARLKLRAEGDKLKTEGDKLWAEGILDVYGNIKLEWKIRDNNFDCHLENGENCTIQRVVAYIRKIEVEYLPNPPMYQYRSD